MSMAYITRAVCFCAVLRFAMFAGMAFAHEEDKPFAITVAPAVSAKCAACHQPANAKGGFVITTREAMLKGGDSGNRSDSRLNWPIRDFPLKSNLMASL